MAYDQHCLRRFDTFLFGLAWVYEKKAQSFLKNQNPTSVGFAIGSFMITKF
jgi:hypothetical protein